MLLSEKEAIKEQKETILDPESAQYIIDDYSR